MELDKIIEALKGKEVDQGVIDAVKGLDQSAEVERLKGELESEQGKGAGILADKKKFKERAEKAEGDLKAIADAKLPEDERHANALKELNDKIAAGETERANDKAEFAKVQREAKLSDITASVKWADGTPSGTAKLIISSAMTDIDLADQTKVDEALKAVKESHKSFIAAEAPGGTGGKGNEGAGSGGGGNEGSSIADNQKEIWAGK